MKNIGFLPLGGLNEEGKNLYFLEINNELFIINYGSKMPNLNGFGVDLIIPDIKYIEQKIKSVKGIIITNGEEDNVGALPYIVAKFPKIPIYANQYAQVVIRHLFKKHKIKSFNLKPLNKKNVFGQIVVKAFPVYFSFPLTVGLSFIYKNEQIIYLGDFFSYKNSFLLSIKDQDILKTKTKLLILGNKNVKEKGYIKSYNQDYLISFKSMIYKNGRKIIAISSKRINEILVMVKYLVKNKKAFCFDNSCVSKIIRTLQDGNQINIPEELWKEYNEMNEIKNIVVFISDIGYSLYHKLNNISLQRHETIKLTPDDNVLIAIGPIASAEVLYYKIIDQFYRQKVHPKIVDKNTYKSYHGGKEDIRNALTLLKPQWIIPIQGYFQDTTSLINLVEEMNMDSKKIISLDNGEHLKISDGKYNVRHEKNALRETLIDGYGVGDISGSIIYEREKMGNSGVLFISFLYNKKIRKVSSEINYSFIGIIDDFAEQNRIKEKVNKFLNEKILPTLDLSKINKERNVIKKKVNSIIKKTINKDPEIVVIVIEENKRWGSNEKIHRQK